MQLSQKVSDGLPPDTIDPQESPFPYARISREESTELPASIPPLEAFKSADKHHRSKRAGNEVAWAAAGSVGFELPKAAGYEVPTSVLYRAGSRAAWIQGCEATDPGRRAGDSVPALEADGASEGARSGVEHRHGGVMRSKLSSPSGNAEEGIVEEADRSGSQEREELAPAGDRGEEVPVSGLQQKQNKKPIKTREQQLMQQHLHDSRKLEDHQQRLQARRKHLEERMAQGTAVMDVDGSINVNLTGELFLCVCKQHRLETCITQIACVTFVADSVNFHPFRNYQLLCMDAITVTKFEDTVREACGSMWADKVSFGACVLCSDTTYVILCPVI